MKVSNRNRFAYNAQAVGDSQEGAIVACEVTRQETDGGQRVAMIEEARETLGVTRPETVTVADTGYGAEADLLAAHQKQMPALSPPPEGKPAGDNPYAGQRFVYDPQAQTVTGFLTGFFSCLEWRRYLRWGEVRRG